MPGALRLGALSRPSGASLLGGSARSVCRREAVPRFRELDNAE